MLPETQTREIVMRSLVFVLFVVTTMCSSDSYSGIDHVPTDAVPLITVDNLDYASLIEEDNTREQMGLPPRFAVQTLTSITPATHGLWEKLPQNKMRSIT